MDENNGNAIVAKPREWWFTTRDFFRETNAEMKKVTWPGRGEVVNTTIVVLIATIVFALFLWGCDVVFYQAIDFIFTKFGSSVGA
jgi:preprotein translocase subunit SecE